MIEIHAVLVGFLVAALVAMTGIGGGCLMAPILVAGMGVPMPVAVGTDLLYSTATKLAALAFYWRRGKVRWRVAALMLTGSLPAAVLALGAIWWMRSSAEGLTTLMSVSLAAALTLSAGAIFTRERLYDVNGDTSGGGGRSGRAAVFTAGAAGGALVSLSSVGAGAIGVAALLLIYSSLELGEIIGTDLAHGVVLAALAAVGHAALGNVDFALLANLLAGMIPGIWLGGRLTGWLPEPMLRRTISLLLLGSALRLVA